MTAVLLKDTLLNLLDKAVRCVQQSTYAVGQRGLLAVLLIRPPRKVEVTLFSEEQ